ncbi:MAG: GAF domain-containing protein [Anaerolineae bacterium]|nr:GAF domain-containing protein [Anaerolineae bacterium]
MTTSTTNGRPSADDMLQQWRDKAVLVALTALSVAALPTLAVIFAQNWHRPAQYPFVGFFVVLYIIALCLRTIKRLGPRVRGWGFLILVYAAGVLSLIRGGLVGVGKDYTLILPLLAILFRSKRAGIVSFFLSIVTYIVVGYLLSYGYLNAWVLYPEAIVDFSIWISEGVYLTLLMSVFFVLLLTFYNYLVRVLNEQILARAELSQTHQTLLFYSQNLEEQVAARTNELSAANVQLRQEIVDRLRAEHGLRFRATLLEQLQDPVVAMDMERNITYLNAAAARFFGVAIADTTALNGASLASLSLEGLGASWEQILDATVDQGNWQGIWNVAPEPGALLNLEVRAWSIKDPEGNPEGMVSIMTDVTARVNSEALLQRHNRELALLNRLITAAAGIADTQHLLEILCRDLAQFFDLKQAIAMATDPLGERAVVVAEYLTPGLLSFLDLEFQISNSMALRYLLDSQSPLFVADLELDERLGELTPLLLERGVASVLLIPLVIRGRVISVLCLNMMGRFALDETDGILVSSVASAVSQTLEAAELRVAIEKTQAADRAKSQFINHVSHELRTPLTNIRAYLDLMRLGVQERRQDYLGIAHGETVRLQHLIEDLLYLSKLDLGQLEVELHPVDLNQVVRELALEREGSFLAQGLELKVELEPSMPIVQADVRALRQVLGSLLTNALHFTPSGGSVVLKTVRLTAEEHEWGIVEVRDTGLGMSDVEQAQLFQRFQRGTAVELTNVPGAGVGLALSKELVELQHGRLTVKSRLQQGSVFTIWLLPA